MHVLGANACQQMGLITVNKENVQQVTALESKVDLIDEYKDVFNDYVAVSQVKCIYKQIRQCNQ